MLAFYPGGNREYYQLKLEGTIKCPTSTNQGLLFLPNKKSRGSMAADVGSTVYL